MDKNSITVNVNGTAVTATADRDMTTGSVGMIARFTFGGTWDGLTKTVSYRAGKKVFSDFLTGSEAVVPWEMFTPENLGRYLEIGVCGYRGDDLIYPTVWVTVGRIVEGSPIDGDPPLDPSANIVIHILEAITTVDKKAAAAVEAADRAEMTAAEAKTTADSVKGIADDALARATGAETTATAAQETAQEAKDSIVPVTNAKVGDFVKITAVDENGNAIKKEGGTPTGGGLPPIPAKVGDFLKVTKAEGGKATEVEGATPAGGGENWVELADFTNEQETGSIKLTWADKPKRKIRFTIYTPAWDVDTNYSYVNLLTAKNVNDYSYNAKFYIHPIPRKISIQTTANAEIIKDPKGNRLSVSTGWVNYDINGEGEILRLQDTFATQSQFRYKDPYGHFINDNFTGIVFGTYQKFPVGTKIYVEGCD